MNSIKYDSVYKFIVSLGVILLALPLFILYLIYTDKILLISEEEYDVLSMYSKKLLDIHLKMDNFFVSHWLGLILVAIILAIIFLGVGMWMWIRADQKKEIKKTIAILDKDVVDEATIESHIKENEEETQSGNEQEEQKCYERLSKYAFKFEISSYKMAKNLFFKYAIKDYLPKPSYIVQLEKKINHLYYDAIAISENADDPDIIYEFKWWHNYKNRNAIYSSAKQLEVLANNYHAMTGRKCEKRLIIVTTDDYSEDLADWLSEILYSWPNDSSTPIINIEIVEEDSLYPYYEERIKNQIEVKRKLFKTS